jgi:hypothetical protein
LTDIAVCAGCWALLFASHLQQSYWIGTVQIGENTLMLSDQDGKLQIGFEQVCCFTRQFEDDYQKGETRMSAGNGKSKINRVLWADKSTLQIGCYKIYTSSFCLHGKNP